MTDISKAAVDVAANVLRVTGEHYLASQLTTLRAALDEAEARAVKAEAERDDAVKFLAEAVDDLKLKESLHTNERGRDCLAFLAAHLGAKP